MNSRALIPTLLATLIPLTSLLAEAPAGSVQGPRIALQHQGESMLVKLPGTREASCWSVQASTDLLHWLDLGDLIEINGSGEFPDDLAPLFKQRYYRAIHHGKDIQALLDRNRARWEGSGIRDYDFTFQWLCFCGPDYVAKVRISVREGKITAVNRVDDGRELEPSDFERYPTIDGLFDFLQEAINLGPYRISARFFPGNGAPRRAWVDYNQGIADEERGFVIEDLRVAGIGLVKITDTPPADLQLDPITLEGASIEGDILTLAVAHSGGCRPHDYELFMSPGAFLKSLPPQANLYLRHDGHGDACEAWTQAEANFNLSPISDLYGRPGTILLNIYDHATGDPLDRIRIDYRQ